MGEQGYVPRGSALVDRGVEDEVGLRPSGVRFLPMQLPKIESTKKATTSHTRQPQQPPRFFFSRFSGSDGRQVALLLRRGRSGTGGIGELKLEVLAVGVLLEV